LGDAPEPSIWTDRRSRQDRWTTTQMRRSVPSAVIGQASPAVARARWGFASEGQRRGSPTGNKVHVEAIEVPAPCHHGHVCEHRFRHGAVARSARYSV
jgi:hypothetical protein